MRGRRFWCGGPLVAIGFLLSACGSTSWPGYSSIEGPRHLVPHPTYKIGAPYTVKGVTYYPHVDLAYDQIGLGSWYGEAFQGQYTANGEVFDLNQITAAHKTLPLPSIVEVTNLQNNRALRVRVNDRGPFVDGRILDVSRRVAQLLGFEQAGTTMIRVRILKDESLRAEAAAERGIISNGTTAFAAATPVASPPPTRVAAVAPSTAPLVPAPPPATPGVAGPSVAPPSAIPPAGSPPGFAVANESPPQTPRQALAPYGAPEPAYRGLPAAAATPVHHFLVQSPLYRMEIGPVDTQEEAQRALSQMLQSGYRDAHIVID